MADTTPTTRPAGAAASVFGPRAMLVASVVGFAVGVVGTLAFAPLIQDLARTTKSGHPQVVHMGRAAQVQRRVHDLAEVALGFSKYRPGQPLLRRVSIMPAKAGGGGHRRMWDVAIRFAVNANAVRNATFGTSRSLVFGLLKAIYADKLPLGDISLVGVFSFPGDSHARIVLRAGSDRTVESSFSPWQSLSRSAEPRVWSALSPHWVSRRFRRYSG